jgi:serine/threonine protein kinase
MTDQSATLDTALAHRYTIERELGRGGMATVYLARDKKHDRAVAIKVLKPELGAAFGAERFLREIGIAARLPTPTSFPCSIPAKLPVCSTMSLRSFPADRCAIACCRSAACQCGTHCGSPKR